MPAIQNLVYLCDPNVGLHVTKHSLKNPFTYYFYVPVNGIKGNPGDLPHWKIGIAKPFLGHKTRTGSEIPSVKIISQILILRKVRLY